MKRKGRVDEHSLSEPGPEKKKGRIEEEVSTRILSLPAATLERIFCLAGPRAVGVGRQVCKDWHQVLTSTTMSECLRAQVALWEVLCYSISQWNGWDQPCDHHPLLVWGFSERHIAMDIIRHYSDKWSTRLTWQEFEEGGSVEARFEEIQKKYEGKEAPEDPWQEIVQLVQLDRDYEEAHSKRILIRKIKLPAGDIAHRILGAEGVPPFAIQLDIDGGSPAPLSPVASPMQTLDSSALRTNEGINQLPEELLLLILNNMPLVQRISCRLVCRYWNSVLHSGEALRALLQESKFYLVTPHLHVEGNEDETVEDEEEGTEYPAGEINCSTFVVRGFSHRHVCIDILRNYSEKYQNLIFLGGDYQPHAATHAEMVTALQKQQRQFSSNHPRGQPIDPNHQPTSASHIVSKVISEFSKLSKALSTHTFGDLHVHLHDYGVVVKQDTERTSLPNIIPTQGITPSLVLTV